MPSEFDAWAAKLRETHPEMFDGGEQHTKRKTAREKWHPLFLRVYGIRPWEMGRYRIDEYAELVADLEKHGLGGL